MAITAVATGTAGGNLTTISLAWSALTATPANGDVAYLIWTCGSAQTVTTDPTGWTLQSTLNSSFGAMRTRVYSRVCTGTESGSISATASAINKQTLSVVVYRGVSNAAPVNAITSRNETVATTSHVCPDVTPTVAGCAIVTMIGERSSTGSTSFTTSGTYTVRVHSGTAAGGSGGTISGIADDGLAASHTANVAVTPAALVGNASVQGVTTWSLAIPPGGSNVTGTATINLGGLAVTATGVRTVPGAASIGLGPLSLSAAGQRSVTGSAAIGLGPLTVTAIGIRAVSGAAAVQLGPLSVTAAGRRTISGFATIGLGALTAAATGRRTVRGSASFTLGHLVVTAIAFEPTRLPLLVGTLTVTGGYAGSLASAGGYGGTLTAADELGGTLD